MSNLSEHETSVRTISVSVSVTETFISNSITDTDSWSSYSQIIDQCFYNISCCCCTSAAALFLLLQVFS